MTATANVPDVLEFDEESHTYTLNGVELPSVTTVIKAAGLVDSTHWNEFARERGSHAHSAIHYALQGDLDSESLHPMLVPYVNAALDLLVSLNVETKAVEERIYSRTYGYAGTVDWIGNISGQLCLIDWKTSATAVNATGLQLAAYADAWHEMTGQRIAHRYSGQLAADGKGRLVEFKDRRDLPRFRAALTVVQTRKEWGL